MRIAANTRRRAAALALLLALALPAGGAEVQGLYVADVPVAGQGGAERNRAIADAFRQVLVKVTGRRSPLGGSGIDEDMAAFVQQYRYLLDEPPAGEPQAEPERRLRVQFDKGAVDAWIRDRGLSVWGSNRPALLLWLGLEQDGRRRLFVPEIDPATSDVLRRSVQARGLSLTLPLMDLEDRGRLQVSDLWGDFAEPVREASKRYEADAVLTGRLEAVSPKLWRGRWTLIQGDQIERWGEEAADIASMLGAGVDRAADTLAARFAPHAGRGSLDQVALRVGGVRSFADYVRLRRHLESVEQVTSLDLWSAGPETLAVVLGVRGDDDTVVQSLGLGGVLVPVMSTGPPGSEPTAAATLPGARVLDFRLSP